MNLKHVTGIQWIHHDEKGKKRADHFKNSPGSSNHEHEKPQEPLNGTNSQSAKCRNTNDGTKDDDDREQTTIYKIASNHTEKSKTHQYAAVEELLYLFRWYVFGTYYDTFNPIAHIPQPKVLWYHTLKGLLLPPHMWESTDGYKCTPTNLSQRVSLENNLKHTQTRWHMVPKFSLILNQFTVPFYFKQPPKTGKTLPSRQSLVSRYYPPYRPPNSLPPPDISFYRRPPLYPSSQYTFGTEGRLQWFPIAFLHNSVSDNPPKLPSTFRSLLSFNLWAVPLRPPRACHW